MHKPAERSHYLLNRVLPATFLLLGFALRVYQLGEDSFWNDEVGVALAATQPNPVDMVRFIRGHVMPMPLDYFTVWLMARCGLQEFYLRFNSVFWGTLAIAVSYVLSRRLADASTARLTAFLLSVSPLHIHYSQELRFYSALIFFYAVSTYFMLRAIQRPTLKNWGLLVAFTVIGSYFHAFVLLVLVNGAIWMLFRYTHKKAVWKFFLGACGLIGIAILPGYLYFRPHQPLNQPLTLYGPVVRAVLVGMGWKELPYQPDPGIGQVWGILCAGLWLFGVKEGFRRNAYLRGIAVSNLVQIALIIAADWVSKYAFVYRHILLILPVAMLFTGLGGAVLQRQSIWRSRSREVAIAVWLMLSLSSLPALHDYYAWPKSTARYMSETIATRWSANDVVLVLPPYQEKVYRFYLQYILNRPDIAASVHAFDPTYVEKTAGNVFLVTISPLSSETRTILSSMDFDPIITEQMDLWLGHSLFLISGVE